MRLHPCLQSSSFKEENDIHTSSPTESEPVQRSRLLETIDLTQASPPPYLQLPPRYHYHIPTQILIQRREFLDQSIHYNCFFVSEMVTGKLILLWKYCGRVFAAARMA